MASYNQRTTVCADLNNNAVCDPGETDTTTDEQGSFLHTLATGPIIAEISTSSRHGNNRRYNHNGNGERLSGNPMICRGDLYVDYLIKKIQAAPVWTNTQKHVAIVIMFDEGTATTGLNSCCGWNPSAGS